jgi:8-oxo-dGTP pyrophosphatase MutT (NUDIX family)
MNGALSNNSRSRTAGLIIVRSSNKNDKNDKNDKKYEMLLQHRADSKQHGANKLALIGGHIDKNESAIHAAYREGIEEASLDKLCSYHKFKKNAYKLSSGKFTCYLLNIDDISEAKNSNSVNNVNNIKWQPKPSKEFRHELNTNIFKNGHTWVDFNDIEKCVKNNVGISDNRKSNQNDKLFIWDLTIDFIRNNAKKIGNKLANNSL